MYGSSDSLLFDNNLRPSIQYISNFIKIASPEYTFLFLILPINQSWNTENVLKKCSKRNRNNSQKYVNNNNNILYSVVLSANKMQPARPRSVAAWKRN